MDDATIKLHKCFFIRVMYFPCNKTSHSDAITAGATMEARFIKDALYFEREPAPQSVHKNTPCVQGPPCVSLNVSLNRFSHKERREKKEISPNFPSFVRENTSLEKETLDKATWWFRTARRATHVVHSPSPATDTSMVVPQDNVDTFHAHFRFERMATAPPLESVIHPLQLTLLTGNRGSLAVEGVNIDKKNRLTGLESGEQSTDCGKSDVKQGRRQREKENVSISDLLITQFLISTRPSYPRVLFLEFEAEVEGGCSRDRMGLYAEVCLQLRIQGGGDNNNL